MNQLLLNRCVMPLVVRSRLAIMMRWLFLRGPAIVFWRLVAQSYRIVTGRPINPNLCALQPHYIGGQHRQRGWGFMQSNLNITAVLNLRFEHDDARYAIVPDTYLYLPVKDNTPPTQEQLWQGVAFISAQIEQGGVVFVHCGVGVGRAPTMVAAYLVSTGLTVAEAWALIRKVRPFVLPLRLQVQAVETFTSPCGDMPP